MSITSPALTRTSAVSPVSIRSEANATAGNRATGSATRSLFKCDLPRGLASLAPGECSPCAEQRGPDFKAIPQIERLRAWRRGRSVPRRWARGARFAGRDRDRSPAYWVFLVFFLADDLLEAGAAFFPLAAFDSP